MQGEEHTIVDKEVWTCCMIIPLKSYNIKVFENPFIVYFKVLWYQHHDKLLKKITQYFKQNHKHRELNFTQFK